MLFLFQPGFNTFVKNIKVVLQIQLGWQTVTKFCSSNREDCWSKLGFAHKNVTHVLTLPASCKSKMIPRYLTLSTTLLDSLFLLEMVLFHIVWIEKHIESC